MSIRGPGKRTHSLIAAWQNLRIIRTGIRLLLAAHGPIPDTDLPIISANRQLHAYRRKRDSTQPHVSYLVKSMDFLSISCFPHTYYTTGGGRGNNLSTGVPTYGLDRIGMQLKQCLCTIGSGIPDDSTLIISARDDLWLTTWRPGKTIDRAIMAVRRAVQYLTIHRVKERYLIIGCGNEVLIVWRPSEGAYRSLVFQHS